MRLNMFGNAAISKRVRYRSTSRDIEQLNLFELLLQLYEYELLPVHTIFHRKLALAYLRRWREILLYAQLVAGVLKEKKVHDLEERYLH